MILNINAIENVNVIHKITETNVIAFNSDVTKWNFARLRNKRLNEH